MCGKCQTSNFMDFSKNFVFIQNKKDFILNEHLINEDNIVMINCNICKGWFHSNCLGINEISLKSYFDEFELFNCLDCYIQKKNTDKYLESTVIILF